MLGHLSGMYIYIYIFVGSNVFASLDIHSNAQHIAVLGLESVKFSFLKQGVAG